MYVCIYIYIYIYIYMGVCVCIYIRKCLVNHGKPFVLIFKTDFLFISICKTHFSSGFQVICNACSTFNVQFKVYLTQNFLLAHFEELSK